MMLRIVWNFSRLDVWQGLFTYYETPKLGIVDPHSPLCNGFGRNYDLYISEKHIDNA